MQQRRINNRNTGLKLIVLLPAVLLSSISYCFADDFKFIKEKDDIQLYEREILYQEQKVREVKAEFILKADPTSIIQLIKDEKKIKEWNSNIGGFRVINSTQPAAWTAYTRFDLPWPFDDQEMVLHYQVTEVKPGKIWDVQFASTSCISFPSSKNISRVRHVKGNWQLEQLSDSRLKVTYRILSERKEEIPKYISDPIVRDHLLSSLHRMKTILEP